MLKIGVCDDDGTHVNIMQRYIERWAAGKGINIELQLFTCGEQLLEHIMTFGRYDLLFLDIELRGMNGLQIAKKIRDKDRFTTLILMSQYDTFFRNGYEVHPFYFFSKPIKEKFFGEILERYLQVQQEVSENITFKKRKVSYSVSLSEVIYFTSDKRLIYIICTDEMYSFYGKLDEVQVILNKKKHRFLRIHKSFLVNMKYINQYHYKNIILYNGADLPISKDYRKSVNEIHMLLLGGED